MKSASLLQLRLRRFKRLKRGYYSFLLLAGAYVLSFFLPFLMGTQALVVRYQGHYYFPVFRSYLYETIGLGQKNVIEGSTLGQVDAPSEADYRELKKQYAREGQGNFVWMPLILSYGPSENFLQAEGNHPQVPSRAHWLGTDTGGRDIFVRLCYGYRTSITFALAVTGFSTVLGVLFGALLGYYGRWLDMLGLRLVEIWSSVPFLYTVIIVSSIFESGFIPLVLILTVFGWMGTAYYIRGEFYREKAKDYVAAAMACGEGDLAIMFRHILPNSLTPIIAFTPFAIVAEIETLVALDFLGYGLPKPTPSWGELMRQAQDAGIGGTNDWHLIVFPLLMMFITL
ncbi:MAG: ABC transporter permease subunit, partial [Planctomycetes bacterium]|nr:ABC transporter permease subunit [Planctomycetota bacterium]